MKQKFYLFISLFLVGVVGFIIFQERKKTNLTFPDFGAALPENHQILGIDVSHHQGTIDWDEVTKMRIGRDSIQFVYVKLSEGTDFLDRASNTNQTKLKALKIPFGVYHFYNAKESAFKQAQFFAKHFVQSDLLPVLDIELQGNLTSNGLIDSVTVFLDVVESELKLRPIIYTYESFYTDFFSKSTLKNELFWIANFTGNSKTFSQSNVIAWQFTDKGTVNGISEKVDLNTAKPTFWKVVVWED